MGAQLDCPVFADAPLAEILAFVRRRLQAGASSVSFQVLDPDLGRGLYAGERVRVGDREFVHRPLRVWIDLAERMHLRLATPRTSGEHLIRLELSPLDEGARWEPAGSVPVTEKYGRDSGYQRIFKAEEPSFVLDLADVLERIGLGPGARVLDLGVNTGDELSLMASLWPELGRSGTFVGVDHSATALEVARARFPGPRHRFVEADVDTLARLDLGAPFDLIVCIGTLQSPGVDDRALLRHLVQDRLSGSGAVVLGLPNCRYLDGELLHGARTKNFRQPELSLLVKNVAFYRRYLQQHRRKVYVTGKHTVLVTGVALARGARASSSAHSAADRQC